MQLAFDDRDQGVAIPFVTTLKETGEIIGATRFFKIDSVNHTAEIGHTWIAGSWQRSCVNTEAKYLMLRYGFEAAKWMRIQISTDELNTRSRAAILRLGARQEGILRKERIVPGGRVRNTVVFSVIDDEWPEIRAGLEKKLRDGGIAPTFEGS
jgi:RimJ/RimL family protein N-acetyltransferase